MSNLKKIVIGLGVVACLATSVFSEELKLDKNFCSNYKTFKYSFFEKIKSAPSLIGMCKATDMKNEMRYGKLSTSMLYESGIGVELAKDYKTLAYTFNEYLLTLSDEDSKELSKFYLVIFLDNNKMMTDYSEETQKKYFAKEINGFIEQMIEQKLSGFSGRDHVNFFVSNFNPKSEQNFNLKLYNNFTKLVLMHDFEKAKEFIRSTNGKYDIDKFFVQYDNECQKIK